MSISVLCPSCSAPVTAPDSAAGKRAKCPKCQEIMQLPDAAADEFEVVEEPKPKKKPRVIVEEDEDEDRPRKKSKARRDEEDKEERPAKKPSRRVMAAEDDEEDERPKKKSRRRDDDEDDERPRKKGKAGKKAGPSMGLLLGGGLALILLVAGGLYFAFSGGGSGATGGGGGGAKAPNWVAFDAPDGSFSAAFPDGAPAPHTLAQLSTASDPQKMAENEQKMKAAGIKDEGWSRSHGDRRYIVVVVSTPPAMALLVKPEVLAEQFIKAMTNTVSSQTDFEAGTFKGKQFVNRDAGNKWIFARVGSAGPGKLVMVLVESKNEIKADDADAKTFFEKFQWKK